MIKNEILHLIEKCKLNDSKAQMQLYDMYCDAMYNTVCNMINDEVIAQDLMHESFIKAFKKIESFNGKATFGAWLKKIVINHSLDWIKKQKLETVELKEDVVHIADEQHWEIHNHIDIKAIYACIEQLPGKCKNVVKLYLLEGYDHQEVAQILQISEVASRSQLSRGKNRLKELLNQIKDEN